MGARAVKCTEKQDLDIVWAHRVIATIVSVVLISQRNLPAFAVPLQRAFPVRCLHQNEPARLRNRYRHRVKNKASA